MIYDVFLSYSRRDEPIAFEIRKAILSVGLSCFTDRVDIPPGADYASYIDCAIKACKIFLYIASENSYNSKWSYFELNKFLCDRGIIGCVVYKVDKAEIPNELIEEVGNNIFERKDAYSQNSEAISDLDLALLLHEAAKDIQMDDKNDYDDIFTAPSCVFISHSHSDNIFAESMHNFLSIHGINCWIDLHDIPAGVPYAEAIMNGLQMSDTLVVLYSRNAITSHDMLDELQEAHTTNKRIIPFMLDDTPLVGQFRYYLARRQWIIGYPDIQTKLIELLSALDKKVDA